MAIKQNSLDTSMPLGRAFGAITKNYYGALSKNLEHLGIDRHFSALVIIDKTEEKCTQQYLSDMLNVDKVSMVRMLDYLFNKGLITRLVNPKDRREHLIHLTSKAKKLLPVIHDGIAEMNRIVLQGLNKSEQELLKKMVGIMMKNVEGLPVNQVNIKLKKHK